MYRAILLTFAISLLPASAIAKSSDPAPATYIMQLSSNLNCETLDIEMVSQAQNIRRFIRFTSGAFAAAELPEGTYSFGEVTCTKQEGAQTYDLFEDKVAPFQLTAGQAYYGGRMIFEEVSEVDVNGAPKVLSNCTNLRSRARGESSNDCRDGVGVNATAQQSKQIKVYFPDVTDEDIKVVRTAMSATKEQLKYLPLKG